MVDKAFANDNDNKKFTKYNIVATVLNVIGLALFLARVIIWNSDFMRYDSSNAGAPQFFGFVIYILPLYFCNIIALIGAFLSCREIKVLNRASKVNYFISSFGLNFNAVIIIYYAIALTMPANSKSPIVPLLISIFIVLLFHFIRGLIRKSRKSK